MKAKELIERIQNGALGALMSGSGPSVFGIFENEIDQKNALFALQKEKITAFSCKSLGFQIFFKIFVDKLSFQIYNRKNISTMLC